MTKAKARLAAIQKDAAADATDSDSDSEVEVTAEKVVVHHEFNKDLPEKFKCFVYNPVDNDWTKMHVKPTTELAKVYKAVADKWPGGKVAVDELNLTHQGRRLDPTLQFATAGFKDEEDARKIEVRKQQDIELTDFSDDDDDGGAGGGAGAGTAAATGGASGGAGGFNMILRHSAHGEQKFKVGQ